MSLPTLWWLPLISICVSVLSLLITVGAMVYFGGKLVGRFEGHENTDNARFNSITTNVIEVKNSITVMQEDIKTLLTR